jgi:hypothetical protein
VDCHPRWQDGRGKSLTAYQSPIGERAQNYVLLFQVHDYAGLRPAPHEGRSPSRHPRRGTHVQVFRHSEGSDSDRRIPRRKGRNAIIPYPCPKAERKIGMSASLDRGRDFSLQSIARQKSFINPNCFRQAKSG